LVGGAVRDALLGRPTQDLDIAVLADDTSVGARQLANLVSGSVVLLDAERGITRVVAQGFLPPHVDLTSLWARDKGDPVLADLAKRDFTCNAIALPLGAAFNERWKDSLIDPFHGARDLDERKLRAVSDSIFRDDPLRLLRAARLAAELGLSVGSELEAAIVRHAPLVSEASQERIRDEFIRLLLLPRSAQWLQRLDSWDLLCRILPELEAGKGVTQTFFHHWDVFEHNVKAVEALEAVLNGEVPHLEVALQRDWLASIQDNLAEEFGGGRPRLVALKLATLLHDVGKPGTKTVEASGRARFFGHSETGAGMAAEAMERLRFSRKEVEAVRLLVKDHLRPTQMGHPPTDRALYRFFRDLGDEAYALLLLHLADARATHGPSIEPLAQEALLRRVGNILRWRFTSPPEGQTKLVDGHRLMAALGLTPGPVVGALLEAIEEAQALGRVHTTKEAVEHAASLLREMPQTVGRSQ
jgi:putative nucleotidyltransferase with HDIG domain